MSEPSAAVSRRAAAKRAPPPSSDGLRAIREAAAMARDLELEISSMEEALAAKKKVLEALYRDRLPSMLDELGLDRIGIPASGNLPGVDYVIRPYYGAGIASSWSDEKKKAAFDLLHRLRADSLIRTEVSAALPRGNLASARKLFESIKKMGIDGAAVELSQTVSSSTLRAWLRELYERGQSLPQSDLDKIGGSVGRHVRPEGRRE